MFHRKDKENVYAEVVGNLYDNKIIVEFYTQLGFYSLKHNLVLNNYDHI